MRLTKGFAILAGREKTNMDDKEGTEMRDRLIGIITELLQSNEKVSVEMIADELLSEGVIVPPCKVGDTVYCDISNVRDGNFLDECIIQSIEFDRDFHEPLFTAICREKAEYQTYWTSDFGKTIFHEPHFAADKKRKKGKK